MKRQTMHVETWWTKHNNKLSAFHAYWEFKHREDPTNFPLNLREGDWDEQFDIFCESVYQAEIDKKGFFSPLDYRLK